MEQRPRDASCEDPGNEDLHITIDTIQVHGHGDWGVCRASRRYRSYPELYISVEGAKYFRLNRACRDGHSVDGIKRHVA